jgi:hypothetical protein
MIHDLGGVYSVVTHYHKAIEAAGTEEPKAVLAKMRAWRRNSRRF